MDTDRTHLSLPTEVSSPDGGAHKKALEHIRDLVRQYAPAEKGVSVVEELIAERHAAAH